MELAADPPHVWRQEVVGAGYASGRDGVRNDYFLVRTAAFTPCVEMTDAGQAAEYVTGWRWWPRPEIAGYTGPGLFSPRDLATPLGPLIEGVLPASPLQLGL